MRSYPLTPNARIDFIEAFNYIAQDSLRADLRWEAEILNAFDHVAEWPLTGRPRPEFKPEELRSWVVGSYVIIYDLVTNPVDIIAFLHGARDMERILSDRYAKSILEEDD